MLVILKERQAELGACEHAQVMVRRGRPDCRRAGLVPDDEIERALVHLLGKPS